MVSNTNFISCNLDDKHLISSWISLRDGHITSLATASMCSLELDSYTTLLYPKEFVVRIAHLKAFSYVSNINHIPGTTLAPNHQTSPWWSLRFQSKPNISLEFTLLIGHTVLKAYDLNGLKFATKDCIEHKWHALVLASLKSEDPIRRLNIKF